MVAVCNQICAEEMAMRLQEKVALVTGGGSGFGDEIAQIPSTRKGRGWHCHINFAAGNFGGKDL